MSFTKIASTGIQTSGSFVLQNITSSGVSTFSELKVGAGSTSAPSISPSGDSNTGIFFPSPDTVAVSYGGTEALRVDSSGRVTMPDQPAFQAYSASNVAQASGTNVLPFNSTNFNIGSHYNTSTYRFTAPVAGRYLFSVNLNLYNAPGIMMPAVRVNGSSLYYGSRLTANISGDNNLNLTIILSLSQNDYVESLSATQGSSANISSFAAWNRFEGYLIG